MHKLIILQRKYLDLKVPCTSVVYDDADSSSKAQAYEALEKWKEEFIAKFPEFKMAQWSTFSNIDVILDPQSVTKPVSVVHEPTQKVTHRCRTVAEAESFIGNLSKTEFEAVERGDYGINAPEKMVNPNR